jgi:hypothetical protein
VTGPRPPYLFDPEVVEERIAPLPRTAKLIHEKKRQGEPSTAFTAKGRGTSTPPARRALARMHSVVHPSNGHSVGLRALGRGLVADH